MSEDPEYTHLGPSARKLLDGVEPENYETALTQALLHLVETSKSLVREYAAMFVRRRGGKPDPEDQQVLEEKLAEEELGFDLIVLSPATLKHLNGHDLTKSEKLDYGIDRLHGNIAWLQHQMARHKRASRDGGAGP